MTGKLKSWLTHPFLALLFRLYIGGVFIYASLYKINYPAEFAQTIAGYDLVPHYIVPLTALVLPWVELISGLCLVMGLRTKTAAGIIIGLLVLFGISIGFALVMETPIPCGCFHNLEEKLTWLTLFRDIIWLLMTMHVYFFDRLFHLDRRFQPVMEEMDR